MQESNPKTLIYSGTSISVIRLKEILEESGIHSLVEDDKAFGLSAGFGGGTDSTIRLFVAESNLAKATAIVEGFTNGTL